MKPWVCPKCGRVYGPSMMACSPCNTAIVEAKNPERERRAAGPAKPFKP